LIVFAKAGENIVEDVARVGQRSDGGVNPGAGTDMSIRGRVGRQTTNDSCARFRAREFSRSG